VSHDGSLVALSPLNERPYLRGRAHTRLVIAGSGAPEPRSYELSGNFEPEAFSVDGKSLFVVSYLPPRKPTNYQVRRLDLVTGKVTGVYTPDAHLQRSMGGTARIQAASPDGTRLYTLYTLAGDKDSEPRAFVHVLSLDELWAHCIELPKGFETSDEESAAITVSPDGSHAYLADSITEAMVEIDAKKLEVARTGTVDLDPGGGTHLAASPDNTLYAASGVDAIAIDLGTFSEENAWQMFSTISGLQIGNDPRQLFVGVRDRIVVLDVDTGIRVESIDPAGVKRIDGFGPVLNSIPGETEEYFTCAC
jgi:DNA-binding beta-propeller fold protein YncE